MMRRYTLSAALFLLGVHPSRAANLIVNGGFENFVVGPNDVNFGTYLRLFSPPPNTDITGWTISGSSRGNPNNVDLVHISRYPAFEGTQSLDMEGAGGTSGVIFQSFATTPGVVYDLSFEYGNNRDGTGASMNVLVTGNGTLLNQNVSHNTSTFTNMDYKLFSQTFTANSATTTLQFSALTNSGFGIAIDAVSVKAVSAVPTTQILPQLAFGGGWYTALYFTNISSTPVSFTVNFIGDDGNPLTVPALGGSSAAVSLAARGTAVIQAPNVGSLVQGYVAVALPTGVTGYGVFRGSVPGQQAQEAVVPLSGTTATTSTLLFDDTNYTTGVAVVNLASVSTTISVTAYGNQGNVIGTSSISLAANAKTAVVLRNLPGLGGIAGVLGSVDFAAPIGNLAVLGLRFNGLAFTSIPTSDR